MSIYVLFRYYRIAILSFIGTLLICLPTIAHAGQQTITIYPPLPGQGVKQEDANLIADTVRARINDDGNLEVINTEESELMLSGTVVAHVKRKKTGYIVSYSLVVRASEYIYFTREQFVEDEAKIEHLGELARKILIAYKQYRDVTVSQIDALIRSEDWGNADRFIRIFLEQRPGDVHLLQRQIQTVNINIAIERIRLAEVAMRKGHFELARINVLGAIERDGENEAWQAYLAELEMKYADFLKQSDIESARLINSLLATRRFDIARARFELLRKQQRLQNDEGERLDHLTANYLEAEQRIVEAKDFAAHSDFATALDRIDAALSLIPGDPVYSKYRETILEQQLDNERFRLLLTGYASEVKAFKPGKLFAEKKTPLSYLSGNLGLSTIQVMDLDESYNEWKVREYQYCTQASLSWEQGLFVPWKFSLSFLSLDIAWGASFSCTLSHRYESALSYGAPLEVNSHIGLLLGVGPIVRLSVASFMLSVGMDLGTGFLSFARKTRAPGQSLELSVEEEVWMCTLSPYFGISWLPSDHRALFCRLRWDNDLLGLSGKWLTSPSIISISAGIGFAL